MSSERDIFIIVGAILFPIVGCWFSMLALRYSFYGPRRNKKLVKILKKFITKFIYISAVLWTIIYASLGYASYRVFDCLRASGNGFDAVAKITFGVYIVQLILYWASMPIFVKFDAWYGILVWSGALLTTVGCAVAFGRIDLIAGLIFIPYIICMLFFAATLNGMLCVTAWFGVVDDIIDTKKANTVAEESTNV